MTGKTYKHNEPDSGDLMAPAKGLSFGCLFGAAFYACLGLTISFFLAPEFWKRMFFLALAISSAALMSGCAVDVLVDTTTDSAFFYPANGRVVMVISNGEYYANDTVGASGCYRLVPPETGEIGEAYYLGAVCP